MKNTIYAISFLLMIGTSKAQWTYRYLTDMQHQGAESLMLNRDTGITITHFASNLNKFLPVISYNGFNSYTQLTALDTSLSFWREIVPTGTNGFMLLTVDSFYISNNYGQTFVTKPRNGLTYMHQWHNNTLFAIGTDPISNNEGLLSSTDTGQTWTLVRDTFDKFYILNDEVIWIMREYPHTDFFEYKTELWRTTNGGSSWQYMHTAYTGIRSISRTYQNCFFIDENIGYWTKESADSLFKTTDGGVTWNYQGAQPLPFFYLYFINEQVGFGGRNSIHKTVDGGKTWTMQKGAPIRGFHCIDSMQCFAYQEEPGAIYYTNNQGGGPFAALPEQESTISNLSLYPNPAHHQLTLQLKEVAHWQPTTIHLYDIVGRLVIQKYTSTSTTMLDISMLTPGMYMVVVTGNGIQESAKVLVE